MQLARLQTLPASSGWSSTSSDSPIIYDSSRTHSQEYGTVPGPQPLGALLPTPSDTSQRASLKKFIKLESQQVVVTFSSYFSSRCGVCTVAEGCWRGFYRFTVTDSSLGHCAVFNFYILFLVSYFFYLGLSGIPITRYLPRSTQSTALWPVTKKSRYQ